MLTIEIRDGNLLKMHDGYDVTEYDAYNLVSELNYYMNNGWKLVSIEDGVYSLEVDREQLMYVEYHNYDNDTKHSNYYTKVMTHADASMIRQYYNCQVEDENEIVYELNENDFQMIDLRFCSEDKINYLIDRDYTNMPDLLELIKESISNS